MGKSCQGLYRKRSHVGQRERLTTSCCRVRTFLTVPKADIAKSAPLRQFQDMSEDTIAEVGIDIEGRLYVRPSASSFPQVYRAAMEVNWDDKAAKLFSPKPRNLTYADWFKQIIAAVFDEYGMRLKLAADTEFVNIPDALRIEIQSYCEVQ